MPFPLFKKAVPRPLSPATVSVARPDRFLRVVLTLIAVALWVNLLQPFLRETAAWAQKGRATKATANRSSSTGNAAHTYAVVLLDKEGHLGTSNNPSADGLVTLSAANLVIALDYFPKHGWRVHSIIPSVGGGGSFSGGIGGITNITTYVLLLER